MVQVQEFRKITHENEKEKQSKSKARHMNMKAALMRLCLWPMAMSTDDTGDIESKESVKRLSIHS